MTPPNARSLRNAVRAFARRHPEVRVFLVGGAVRDGLLGRRTSDYDFALRRGEEELARELERSGFGRAVRISSARSRFPVWRLAGPRLTVDIARFETARSIEGDLARRDFTVNAIARDAASGELIDPLGGRSDIRKKRIRIVSPRNLDADPIRALRAYRLAAELGFTIERETRAALARSAPAVGREAKERVHAELARLFSARRSSRAVGWAVRDGILAAAFGLPPVSLPGAARWLRRFDAARLPDARRFRFRVAALFHRAGVGADAISGLLVKRGFSRAEAADISRQASFLSAVFSREPASKILFEFREHWPELRRLPALAALGPDEKALARSLARRARRLDFRPPPVDGRDIARWRSLPPGEQLGRELRRARFLFFTRRASTREGIEKAVGSFDEPESEE